MPGRKSKPPRLYLRTERDGSRVWIILDRGRQIRTGCHAEEVERASDALKDYLGTRHKPTIGARDPAAVAIGDVLTAYAEFGANADPNRYAVITSSSNGSIASPNGGARKRSRRSRGGPAGIM